MFQTLAYSPAMVAGHKGAQFSKYLAAGLLYEGWGSLSGVGQERVSPL